MTTMAEYEEAVANGDTINDQGGPTMPTDRARHVTGRPNTRWRRS